MTASSELFDDDLSQAHIYISEKKTGLGQKANDKFLQHIKYNHDRG